MKCEQPGIREVGIWPAFVDLDAEAECDTLVLLEQERTQPPSDEAVEILEGGWIGLLEVSEPTPQHPVEIDDHDCEAVASCPFRLIPDAVLELVQTLLAHEAPAGFEPVAQELEPFPRLPAVADMRLGRVQRQAIGRDPRSDRKSVV